MDLSPTSEPTVEEGMTAPMAPMTIHVIGEDEDPQEMLQAWIPLVPRFWNGLGYRLDGKFGGNVRNVVHEIGEIGSMGSNRNGEIIEVTS